MEQTNVSAREHQTHHDKEPEKRHHVGKKNLSILQYEFYGLMINYNPNLDEALGEKTRYENKVKENVKALKERGIITSILSKYQSRMDREFFQLVKKFL